ncbi:MAG TPA: helix-turn-helix transcriptional regulator [Shinella sp.]|jgi:DNA-binding XRE family transcriptional regulator|uniref:helix-turn-helix domain-containing protein n=1 Tax=Shinella sp. TaxID=1870904 RepID=UPI0029BC1EEF|nr:helix-turn-helix transcriptional regulator [Shinella sp.]MDX3977311.1 helix-turn-helix transcriptional regulator [Shinella sp.]HEV7248734.1 helix-turn-helix transcriptional regulator [Shinella sp.]
MNSVVSFKTPNGEEMVILSRGDYDALLRLAELAEDLEDLAAVEAYKQRVAAGEEEGIPSEFVDRLIDGESPVRVWRDFRGMSSKELAKATGISTAYLSEIETGKKEGSISVFRSIAKALRVDLDDLFWGEDSKRPVNE